MKHLSPYADRAYALLRIVAGFMFSLHGFQKIFGILGGMVPATGSQLWFAGLIESIAGALILLGFRTRWAAFIASGEMAVAYFQVHWRFQLGPEFFPIINQGELAVLYCFAFLYIACRGSGPWALDPR